MHRFGGPGISDDPILEHRAILRETAAGHRLLRRLGDARRLVDAALCLMDGDGNASCWAQTFDGTPS